MTIILLCTCTGERGSPGISEPAAQIWSTPYPEWYHYSKYDDSLAINNVWYECIGNDTTQVNISSHVKKDTLIWRLHKGQIVTYNSFYLKHGPQGDLVGYWYCIGTSTNDNDFMTQPLDSLHKIEVHRDSARLYVTHRALVHAELYQGIEGISHIVVAEDTLLLFGEISQEEVRIVFKDDGMLYTSDIHDDAYLSREELLAPLASCDSKDPKPQWFIDFLEGNISYQAMWALARCKPAGISPVFYANPNYATSLSRAK